MEQIQTLTRRLTLQEIVQHAASEKNRIEAEKAAHQADHDRRQSLDWIRAFLRSIFGSELDSLATVETDDQIIIDGFPFARRAASYSTLLCVGAKCPRCDDGLAWHPVFSMVDVNNALTSETWCESCNEIEKTPKGITYISTAERLESIIRMIVREELEAGQ